MTQFGEPQCERCKHIHYDKPGFTCDAFPDGIPGAILHGGHDHRKPFPGDGGIEFEPMLAGTSRNGREEAT